MTKLYFTFLIITTFLLIDVFGAFAWFFSGQALPESGYYVGRITVEILRFLINLFIGR